LESKILVVFGTFITWDLGYSGVSFSYTKIFFPYNTTKEVSYYHFHHLLNV
jgi:hypothetical protein